MKIHGNSKVSTVKKEIRNILGIEVEIRNSKTNKPASDNDSFASLYKDGYAPKPSGFKPDGKMLISNLEQAFQKHYGVKIRVLNPEGKKADQGDSYGQLRRRYAQASGARPPLAEWLEKTMKKGGYSAEDLALKAGISALTVANIQFGDTQNPQAATLEKIEKALGEKIPEEVKSEVKEDAETGFGELVDFDPWEEDGSTLIPKIPGIYVLYDITDRPVYVGKSESSIRKRIQEHKEKKWFTRPYVSKAAYVQIMEPDMIARVEKLLIRFLKSNALVNKALVERDS